MSATIPISFAIMFMFSLYVAGAIAIEYSSPQLRRFKFFRQIYFQTRFEGLWVSYAGVSDRPYAFCSIYYDGRAAAWVYRGVAYDPAFKPAAQWKTYSVSFEQLRHRWLFDGANGGGASLLVEGENGPETRNPPGNVVCVLELPDADINVVKRGFATDLNVNGDELHAFRIYLRRVPLHVLERVINERKEIHIEKIQYPDQAAIIKACIEAGILNRSTAVRQEN